MTQTIRSTKKPASSPIDVDRELLVKMISRVNDPVVARVFLCTVDMHPDLKLQFLGAYLTAEEAVKRSQIRYAKARDMGMAVARSKRLVLNVLADTWTLSVAFAARVHKAHKRLKQNKVRQAAEKASSSNIILLPLPHKATGMDN